VFIFFVGSFDIIFELNLKDSYLFKKKRLTITSIMHITIFTNYQ